jgi:hypothetical protein
MHHYTRINCRNPCPHIHWKSPGTLNTVNVALLVAGTSWPVDLQTTIEGRLEMFSSENWIPKALIMGQMLQTKTKSQFFMGKCNDRFLNRASGWTARKGCGDVEGPKRLEGSPNPDAEERIYGSPTEGSRRTKFRRSPWARGTSRSPEMIKARQNVFFFGSGLCYRSTAG